jgi:hypothetical protein
MDKQSKPKKVGRPRLNLTPEERKKRSNERSNKAYHEKHKYRRRQLVQCECGMMVSRAGLLDHQRRSLHANNMELIKKIQEKYKLNECVVVEK